MARKLSIEGGLPVRLRLLLLKHLWVQQELDGLSVLCNASAADLHLDDAKSWVLQASKLTMLRQMDCERCLQDNLKLQLT